MDVALNDAQEPAIVTDSALYEGEFEKYCHVLKFKFRVFQDH